MTKGTEIVVEISAATIMERYANEKCMVRVVSLGKGKEIEMVQQMGTSKKMKKRKRTEINECYL